MAVLAKLSRPRLAGAHPRQRLFARLDERLRAGVAQPTRVGPRAQALKPLVRTHARRASRNVVYRGPLETADTEAPVRGCALPTRT